MFNLIYNNTVLFLLLIDTATVLIREFNININQYHDVIAIFNEASCVIISYLAISLHTALFQYSYYLLCIVLMLTIIFDIALMYRLNKIKLARTRSLVRV